MKINYKNLLILSIGIVLFIAFISDWIIALVFGGTFTGYGLFINLMEILMCSMCYDYIENCIKKSTNSTTFQTELVQK
jgi:O-antigen/teichoic acid export membrane protein